MLSVKQGSNVSKLFVVSGLTRPGTKTADGLAMSYAGGYYNSQARNISVEVSDLNKTGKMKSKI